MHFHRYCFMLRLLCIYSFNGQVISTQCNLLFSILKKRSFSLVQSLIIPFLIYIFHVTKGRLRNFFTLISIMIWKKRTRKDFSLSKLSCRNLIISANKYRIFNIFRGTFNNFLYSFIDWWLVQCRRRFMIDLW